MLEPPDKELEEIEQHSEQSFQDKPQKADSSSSILPAFTARSVTPVKCNDDNNVNNFFDEILSKESKHKKIAFILVCHMAPTLYLNLIHIF